MVVLAELISSIIHCFQGKRNSVLILCDNIDIACMLYLCYVRLVNNKCQQDLSK